MPYAFDLYNNKIRSKENDKAYNHMGTKSKLSYVKENN